MTQLRFPDLQNFKSLARQYVSLGALHIADLVFPPTCPLCSRETGAGSLQENSICYDCWSKLQFCAEHHCIQCAAPMPSDLTQARCFRCQNDPAPYSAMRTAFYYQLLIRKGILRLKHGDHLPLARVFARMLARRNHDWLCECDIIIPVPLHKKRLQLRMYNQAALIAQELARLCGVPVLLDGLERTRNTSPQGHMSRVQRAKNVKDSFDVTPRNLHAIAEKRCLIIDDVFTTGATVRNCAQALIDAKAADVRVVTVAVAMR
ncbi:MAG: ComF family protein [Pseudomonadota bacterium]